MKIILYKSAGFPITRSSFGMGATLKVTTRITTLFRIKHCLLQ